MSGSDLANAPVIDTDIPTALPYYYQTGFNFLNGEVAGGQAGGDVNRKFVLNSASTCLIAMDNVPNSFAQDTHKKGIIGVVTAAGYNGRTDIRVVLHKPVAHLKGYITDWDVLDGIIESAPASDPNVSGAVAAQVASQRQGQFAYVFTDYTFLGLSTNTFRVTVTKVTREEYVQVAAVSGGAQVGSTRSGETVATMPIISVNNGQFFVSDEEQPFVWNVSGSIEGGGTVKMTGFRDDDSGNIGYHVDYPNATTAWYGQSAAFYQEFTAPTDVHGFGPYLVQPWSSGAYNPPELWYFVREYAHGGFETTGRFLIYRSQWRKDAYMKPTSVTFADDPDFVAGNTIYPSLNPLGYGWETDIFNDAHLVSTVGPFSGFTVYNPKTNYLAAQQNAANSGQPIAAPSTFRSATVANSLPFGFAVLRDKKRHDTLHLIAMDGGIYPSNGTTINRIWFCNSSDDGASWSSMQQIGPEITPATEGTGQLITASFGVEVARRGMVNKQGLLRNEYVSYGNWNGQSIASIPVVRTHDDFLLLGNLTRYTEYRYPDGTVPPYYMIPTDAGSKAALAVIDYTGTGLGIAEANASLFSRPANRGSVSWL